jgi:hypothetical protein
LVFEIFACLLNLQKCGAPVLNKQAPTRAAPDSLDHVDIGHHHSIIGVKKPLLGVSHGIEASFADDHAVFALVVVNALCVGGHVFYLLQRQLNDLNRVSSLSQAVFKSRSLFLVSKSVETDKSVLSM